MIIAKAISKGPTTNEDDDTVAAGVGWVVDAKFVLPVIDCPEVSCAVDDRLCRSLHRVKAWRGALAVQWLAIVQQYLATRGRPADQHQYR